MNNQAKISIFAGLLALLLTSSASAEKLCLKVAVNKKNGRVTTSRTIAAACPRGFTELVDTSAFVGPQGPVGPRGPAGPAGANGVNGTNGTNGTNGGFDLTSCRSELITFPPCEEGNACGYDVVCGDDGLTGGSRDKDVMINWSWDATESGAAYINFVQPISLRVGEKFYPTGVSINARSETGYGAHTARIGIICCLPQ